jgi:hypothetical protein
MTLCGEWTTWNKHRDFLIPEWRLLTILLALSCNILKIISPKYWRKVSSIHEVRGANFEFLFYFQWTTNL